MYDHSKYPEFEIGKKIRSEHYHAINDVINWTIVGFSDEDETSSHPDGEGTVIISGVSEINQFTYIKCDIPRIIRISPYALRHYISKSNHRYLSPYETLTKGQGSPHGRYFYIFAKEPSVGNPYVLDRGVRHNSDKILLDSKHVFEDPNVNCRTGCANPKHGQYCHGHDHQTCFDSHRFLRAFQKEALGECFSEEDIDSLRKLPIFDDLLRSPHWEVTSHDLKQNGRLTIVSLATDHPHHVMRLIIPTNVFRLIVEDYEFILKFDDEVYRRGVGRKPKGVRTKYVESSRMETARDIDCRIHATLAYEAEIREAEKSKRFITPPSRDW